MRCLTNQSSVQRKMCLAQAWNSNLSVLNASLGATIDSLRGEQTLQKLHLVKGDVSAKSPQAGSLTVLIVYLQALAHKPENISPGQTDIKHLNDEYVLQYVFTRQQVLHKRN